MNWDKKLTSFLTFLNNKFIGYLLYILNICSMCMYVNFFIIMKIKKNYYSLLL